MHKSEKIREMLKQQQESGLSVREFCFNYGISSATFYNQKKWLTSYDRKPNLVPIIIKEKICEQQEINESVPAMAYGNSLLHQESLGALQVLEIKYPNGTELRLSVKELDKNLLQILLTQQGR